MRFLHLNHRYHPFTGGSEIYVKELSERLAALGHDVTVITSMASDLEYLWDARKRGVSAPSHEVIGGVEVRRLPAGRFPGQRIVTPLSRRAMGELSRLHAPGALLKQIASVFPKLDRLEESMRSGNVPDAVLATNIGLEGMAQAAQRFAQQQGVPFVLIPFTHVGDDGDIRSRRFVSMAHQRALLRSADLVLTLTDFEADFIRSLGVPDYQVRAIYCGASEDLVTGGCGKRFRRRIGGDGLLVGALGALAPEKGTPQLVQAVGALRERGMDVELVLAGPSMSSFDRWWDNLPARERQGIHRLGVIDEDEKRDLLDAIDMLALPSRTESFGIVYLEAWLNQKPVIAARAGAVPEVVRDGENGLLVEFGDVEGLAKAIICLNDDREWGRQLGAAGRDRARRLYTWDGVFRQFRSAYADVLGMDLGEAD